MLKKMVVTDESPRPYQVAIDERTPYAILVVSPDVYDALQAASEVAFEDPSDVPIEHREAASEIFAAFHDG
jgi:hypothetical protein